MDGAHTGFDNRIDPCVVRHCVRVRYVLRAVADARLAVFAQIIKRSGGSFKVSRVIAMRRASENRIVTTINKRHFLSAAGIDDAGDNAQFLYRVRRFVRVSYAVVIRKMYRCSINRLTFFESRHFVAPRCVNVCMNNN